MDYSTTTCIADLADVTLANVVVLVACQRLLPERAFYGPHQRLLLPDACGSYCQRTHCDLFGSCFRTGLTAVRRRQPVADEHSLRLGSRRS